MSLADKVRFLLFVGGVACVFCVELLLVSFWTYGRFVGKPIAAVYFTKAALAVHIPAIIGILCFLYAWFIEPHWLKVNRYTVESEKISGDGLRIVHLADIHCEKKVRNEEKLVEIVNSLEPDIVVFTGDTLNNYKGFERFKKIMKHLKSKAGKFAVEGNIDVKRWQGLDLYEDTGFVELEEGSKIIETEAGSIFITGLSCKYPYKCRTLLDGVSSDMYSVFLYHYPDLIEDVPHDKVDLYLCGHTHGGQVALPFYGAIITMARHGKKYEAGMYKVGGTTLYVNSGLGLDGGILPRVRFFARPEIAVFDIVPESD